MPHVYSEIGITPDLVTLDVNLEEPAGVTDLDFIEPTDIDESESFKTLITVDTSAQLDGFYDLHLWSLRVGNPDATIQMDYYLREDIIRLEITSYIRDDELDEAVSVRKDELLVIIIPNCYASIPITDT